MLEQIPAKNLLLRAHGEHWFGIDYTMNLYRGCCHGCIYCDSRSECYGIEEFDRVRVKADALTLLRHDLRCKRTTGVVGMGAMSDPYNPHEQTHRLTRGALELFAEFGFGVTIATKSSLLARDIDVLQEIARRAPVLCKMTVTTADDALCRKIEPHVCPSSERFETIRQLSCAGVFSGVLLMPVLPFLTDSEENIRTIVRKTAASGAKFLFPMFGMTLRQNQRDWYFDKLREQFLEEDYPARYRHQFGSAYECRSPQAGRLWSIFKEECAHFKLLYRMEDIIAAYQIEPQPQLTLF